MEHKINREMKVVSIMKEVVESVTITLSVKELETVVDVMGSSSRGYSEYSVLRSILDKVKGDK
jgi:hypothetical protein